MENTVLIKRCQSGDLNSFSELYQRYKKKALGTAYLISNHKGIADDIVQEAFIECFKKLKNIKNPETFEVWFYKVLVRTGWRMVKKHDLFILLDDETIEGIRPTSGSYSEMNASETNLLINGALEKLSLPLRTVVVLHYFNDLTIEEISKVLGCFQGTVKSRLYNARKQLLKALSEGENQSQTKHILVCNERSMGCAKNS